MRLNKVERAAMAKGLADTIAAKRDAIARLTAEIAELEGVAAKLASKRDADPAKPKRKGRKANAAGDTPSSDAAVGGAAGGETPERLL